MTTYADPTTAAIHQILDELRRGNGSPCQPSTTTKAFGWPLLRGHIFTDCFGTTQSWLDLNPQAKAKVAVMEAPEKSLDGVDYSSKEVWEEIAFGLTAPILAAQAPTTKGAEDIPKKLPQDEKFWGFALAALQVVGPAIVNAFNRKEFDPELVVASKLDGVDLDVLEIKGWFHTFTTDILPVALNALSQLSTKK